MSSEVTEPIGTIEDETPDAYIVRPRDAETITQIPKADDRYTEAATDQTVKRHLYVIRAVLYARYIREIHAFPELDFPVFLDATAKRFESAIVAQTRTLIERKQQERAMLSLEMFSDEMQSLFQSTSIQQRTTCAGSPASGSMHSSGQPSQIHHHD